jgi:hypothetical protein
MVIVFTVQTKILDLADLRQIYLTLMEAQGCMPLAGWTNSSFSLSSFNFTVKFWSPVYIRHTRSLSGLQDLAKTDRTDKQTEAQTDKYIIQLTESDGPSPTTLEFCGLQF